MWLLTYLIADFNMLSNFWHIILILSQPVFTFNKSFISNIMKIYVIFET